MKDSPCPAWPVWPVTDGHWGILLHLTSNSSIKPLGQYPAIYLYRRIQPASIELQSRGFYAFVIDCVVEEKRSLQLMRRIEFLSCYTPTNQHLICGIKQSAQSRCFTLNKRLKCFEIIPPLHKSSATKRDKPAHCSCHNRHVMAREMSPGNSMPGVGVGRRRNVISPLLSLWISADLKSIHFVSVRSLHYFLALCLYSYIINQVLTRDKTKI